MGSPLGTVTSMILNQTGTTAPTTTTTLRGA